jgi:multiple sugar transport system permease protein
MSGHDVAVAPALGATRRGPFSGRAPSSVTAQRRRFAVLMLTPALLGMLVFFGYPLVATVYFSFTRFDLVSAPQWIGLRNYRYFLHEDPSVWQSVRNTLWLTAVLVPARILFGLACAGIVTSVKRGASVLRTLYYLPALAPPVAATVAFVFLFNPATGPVNQALGWVGVDGPLWFNDPSWAKPGLALLGLWGVGDIMIILMAALLDVPRDQYEAASLDGANARQRFRYVTLPNISPVLVFAVVTGVIAMLQYFTEAVVAAQVASGRANQGEGTATTLGYPNGSTLTFAQWLYQEGFTNFYLGYTSALSVVMFVVAVGFIALLLARSRTFVAGGEA